MKQWIDGLAGKPKAPVPGCISLLYCRKEDYSPWLYNTITAIYRKRTEWYTLISDMWTGPKLVESGMPSTLKHSNPFFYNQAISTHLDKLICLNIALRMAILKYVQRRLLKKMDQRVVGEDDLHTTTAIPANMTVAVYDFKTRAKYLFHTNTILKMILSSLRYCAYGIASPKPPKNPYTNLEWTKPQLMSITQQMICNLARIHRIPPPMFLNYYNCNYVISVFAKFCEKELGVHAAAELFKLKDDPTTQDIYGETIDEIIEEQDMHISARMRSMIIERKLTDILQNRWDSIVMAIWIYTNINILHNDYKFYEDMIDDFRKLYDETRIFMYDTMRRTRHPRPPNETSLARTYALNVLIDAAIYTENVLELNEEPPLTVNL